MSEIFQRILVGVDAEGLARAAVVRGYDLARELESELELVHAVEVPPPLWPGIGEEQLSEMHAAVIDASRQRTLQALDEALQEPFPDVDPEASLEVVPGKPARVLLQRAEEREVDLLVLGPHGQRATFDFGSTARAVLARAACPVWNQLGPVQSVERILVPVDFSEQSRDAAGLAARLARRLGASLTVLHGHQPMPLANPEVAEAFPDPGEILDQAREAAERELAGWVEELEGDAPRVRPLLVEEAPAQTIRREAENHDLVVMGTHGRTGLSRFLLGSVAYAVLKHAEKPVLVVPRVERSWQLGGNTSGAS